MNRKLVSQQGINRRQFLKIMGAVCGQAAFAFAPVPHGQLHQPAKVAIPPSLMLHSVDGRLDFLPPLLEKLNAQGFTGTSYQEWRRRILQNQPIAKPIIISIDDISLVQQGCPAFDTFVQMKQWLQDAGMTAVYAIITEPIINGQPLRTQDEARWDIMQSWIEDGFELASHTSYHSNFNAGDSTARQDFTAIDYEAEIKQSAQLIEAKMAERSLAYQVQSLILPFGSGYTYQQPNSHIHTGIITACQQTNIKFVVGIPQGRTPINMTTLSNPDSVVYVGRTPPAYSTHASDQTSPNADWTFSWLQAWHNNNQELIPAQTFMRFAI